MGVLAGYKIMSKLRLMYRMLLYVILFCSILPKDTFAHASLVGANPAPDSEWMSSPTEIRLTFNESIDQQLYDVKVFDGKGRQAADKEAVLSGDQKVLSLDLPLLANGVYTVSYRVLSEDGHPVRGTYIFYIGTSRSDQDHELNHTALHRGISEYILYGANTLYLLSFLLLIGWVFWGIWFRPLTDEYELRKRYQFGALVLQQFHLLALLILMSLSTKDIVSSLKGTDELVLPLGSIYGLAWLALLALSITGFLLLLRSRLWDGIWIVLTISFKSLIGHAITKGPPMITVPMNTVHLLSAAVWAGGLLLILMFWRRYQLYMRDFLSLFSPTAMGCIALLSVSGLVSAILFLPKLRYLFYSSWGVLICIKITMVLVVIVAGAVLNRFLKQKCFTSIGKRLKYEMGLMVVIVMIVGVLVHQNPIPSNKPLSWEAQGDQIRILAQITPNTPGGINRFIVDITVSEPAVNPKRAEIRLYLQSQPEIAPITIPLKKDTVDDSSQRYSAEGEYAPFPGTWTVEIGIMDRDDHEHIFRKQVELFAPPPYK